MRSLALCLLLACSSAPPEVVAYPDTAAHRGYCGDGRVTGEEVCDIGSAWEHGCPDGWGVCWTCAAGCRAWSSIHMGYDPGPDSTGPTPWHETTVYGLGDVPLACEERRAGEAVRRTFDDRGRLLTRTGWPWRAEWTWDDGGRPLTRRTRDKLHTWTYDRRGEPLVGEVFDVWVNETGSHVQLAARTRWQYDDRGKLVARIETLGAAERAFRTERFVYDARGRLVAQSREGPAEDHRMHSTFAYDERDRPIELSGARVSYDDARGVIVRVEPTGGRWTWFHRNGRIYRYESAAPSGATEIELVQDALGRTVGEHHLWVENGTHSRWTWDWGPFGITRELRLESGEERVTTWTYDDAGALVASDDGRISERMEYDAAGRIVHHARATRDETAFDARFEWSQAGELLAGELHRPGASQREEWTWRDGVLSRRARIGLPPSGGRIDYDYRCLARVFRSMPRRRYREPARWRVYDVVHTMPRHLYMDSSDRHRFDPAEWTFRY